MPKARIFCGGEAGRGATAHRAAAWLGVLMLAAAGCVASSSVEPRPSSSLRSSSGAPEAGSRAGSTALPLHLVNRYVGPGILPGGEGTSQPLLPTLKLSPDGPIRKVLRPSNDRVWSPDQAVLPYVEFRGDLVKVHNIRNAEYRTVDDYTVHYYDKVFDLRKLTSVDLIVVPFADTPAIAHVMLSFGFEGKDFVVVSIEIRKEKGEQYSAVKGFFNQYELMYVLADERDVLWKNSIGWLCEVYLYHTKATPDQVRGLFADVMRRVNKLAREPEFYNTLTNNCTTNVRQHINRLAPDRVPYDYRVLLPGYSDRLAYDLGLLETAESFEQTKARARVNYTAYLYRDDPDFSQKIRQ